MNTLLKITRFVISNKVLDQINIEPLITKYKACGSSFHPRMLLKVLVFAFNPNRTGGYEAAGASHSCTFV